MAPLVQILIAEDDPLQATRLQRMIETLEPDWDVLPIVADWPACATCVEEMNPDVLFLDLHMPGTPDGAALETLLHFTHQPIVIVTTGDPALALQAYDAEALDYLVKPLKMERLGRAITHANEKLRAKASLGSLPVEGGARRWLTASRGADALLVAPEDVIYFQAERKYTRLMIKDSEAIVRIGINEVSKMLDDSLFVKVNRSAIVNTKHIERVRRDEMGRLRVHLKDRKDTLIVSQPFAWQFKTL